VLVTVVILTAVLPTLVAQSFFNPQRPRVLGGLEGDIAQRGRAHQPEVVRPEPAGAEGERTAASVAPFEGR